MHIHIHVLMLYIINVRCTVDAIHMLVKTCLEMFSGKTHHGEITPRVNIYLIIVGITQYSMPIQYNVTILYYTYTSYIKVFTGHVCIIFEKDSFVRSISLSRL